MSEIELMTMLYEKIGGFGFGLISLIIILQKNKKTRQLLLRFLFYRHMSVQDPLGQYQVLAQQLKYWINSKGSFLVFHDKGRQLLFQDLVHIKLTIFKKYQEILLHEYRNIKTEQELYDYFMDSFQKSNEEMIQEQKRYGIPEVAIEKYLIWSRPNYIYTLNQIEGIQFSKAYKSIPEKVECTFNIIRSNMKLALVEAERTLLSLNGSLTGLEYKGYICGPLPHSGSSLAKEFENLKY